jgi:hypothetical protein
MVREGVFAMINGDPGKCVVLRLQSERVGKLHDLTVGAVVHPSSNLADFYREMGDLFAVELRPHNRWGASNSSRPMHPTHLNVLNTVHGDPYGICTAFPGNGIQPHR